MIKSGLFAFAAQFAPRLFQVRRRTWIAVGVGLLVLFILLIWAGLALMGWLFGQAQGWMGGAPEAARGAIEQVERALPGAREKLGKFVPALKPMPTLNPGPTPEPGPTRRDVSGTDLGPVARYPGLPRTYWQRDGNRVTIEYQGEADYVAVLDHYTNGFAAQGYAQSVQSAAPTGETHEYTKGSQRIGLQVAQLPQGVVRARIEIQ
ncbi:MAG: hypothetical protein ACYC4K_08150 [Thiobacillus sp.]